MTPPVAAPADLADVVDPDEALEISREGVAEQRREEWALRVLVSRLATILREPPKR